MLALPLLRKILVAIDGSDASLKATDFALALAKNNESEVVFLHVVDPAEATKGLEKHVKPTPALPEPADKVYLRTVLVELMKKYEPRIARSNARHSEQIVVGKPSAEIVQVAKKLGVDMIVLGFVGLKGIQRVRALDSVSRAVSEHSNVPVTIVPW